MKQLFFLIALFGILSSCSKSDNHDNIRYIPGEVSVGIKSGTESTELFEFINQFDHEIEKVTSLVFLSDMKTDSLQVILDSLNSKTYLSDGVHWNVTGYINANTGRINIFPKFFGIENVSNQNDWLRSINRFQLTQKHFSNSNSGVIRFKVPVGEEKAWKDRFLEYIVVAWAELNTIADIKIGSR